MKKLGVYVILCLFSACSPKKSTTTQTNAGIQNITGPGSQLAAQCAQTTVTNRIGVIYANTQQEAANFENEVKKLLSATMSPYSVGSVSAQGNATTGVRFDGKIKLDNSGNIIAQQTKLNITVYDSYWQSNQIAENLIQIGFDATKGSQISGQFNTQTGLGTLILKDQYGEIRLEGKIDAQSFSGTVKYQNLANILGGQPFSGTIGQFFIQSCAVLQ